MMDFVNFKIKSAQSFKCAHKDRLCVVYEDLHLYYISQKKKYSHVIV
jgi:hypothetical protein